VAVVDELITELSYKVNDTGLKKHSRLMLEAERNAKKLESVFKKPHTFKINTSQVSKFNRELVKAKAGLANFSKFSAKPLVLKINVAQINRSIKKVSELNRKLEALSTLSRTAIHFNTDNTELITALSSLNSLLRRLNQTRSNAERPINIRANASQLNQAIRASNRFNRSSDQLSNVAVAYDASIRMMRTGLGTLSVALNFANDAKEFESAMGVMMGATGFSQTRFKELEKSAIDAGIATKFDPIQAVQGLQAIGKTGKNASDTMRILKPTLDLAAASANQLDVSMSAGTLTSALAAYNRGANQARATSDSLVRSTQLTKLSFKDLDQVFAKSGSTARDTDQTMGTFLATIGQIKKMGGSAASAAQGFNSVMSRLANSKGNIQVAKGLQALNIGAQELRTASGAMRPFPDLLDLIGGRLDKVKGSTAAHTAELKRQIMQQLFAQKGTDAFSKAMLGGSRAIRTLGTAIDQANKITNSQGQTIGASEAAAQSFMQTTAGLEEQMKGTFDTIKIVLGKPMLESLAGGFGMVLKFLNPFLEWLYVTPGAAKAVGTAIVALGAGLTALGAIGVVAFGFQLLLPVLGAIGSAIGAIAFNPIVVGAILAAVAIGAVVKGIYDFATSGTGFIADLTAKFPFIGTVAMAVVQAFEAIRDQAMEVFEGLNAAVQQFAEGMGIAGDVGVIDALIAGFVLLISTLLLVVSSVVQIGIFITQVVIAALAIIGSIATFIGGLIAIVVAIVITFVALVLATIDGMITSISDFVVGGIELLKKLFTDPINAIPILKQAVSDAISYMTSHFKTGLETVKGIFSTAFNTIKGIIQGVLGIIDKALSSVGSLLRLSNQASNVQLPSGKAGVSKGGISFLPGYPNINQVSSLSLGGITVNVSGSNNTTPLQTANAISTSIRNEVRSIQADLSRAAKDLPVRTIVATG
jgi:TP901 family phage tail tape measure protein